MIGRRLFLGVERSVSGRAWRDRLDDQGRAQALAIGQAHDLPDILCRILAGRGVTSEKAPAFLEPTIRGSMPDPATLTDMDRAVARLVRAVETGEKVAIFGDYDVDGATSSSVMALFLRRAGLDPVVHIPDRIYEGYGPNAEAISRLRGEGATLLLTLDCGTTSHEVLAAAAADGLDIVVLDHHQADERLPPVTALVNPNRLDDLSGLGHLCAAGVTFMAVVALNRALREAGFWRPDLPEPDLMHFLDLVALGTVADVVPLVGLNRAFVARGLSVLRKRENVGLRALMDAAKLDGPPSPYHLGFLLGPRINAGGRIGDAGLGARLMMTEDSLEATRIATELDRLNRERQTVEQGTLAQAEAEALAEVGPQEAGGAVIVTAGVGWHSGVVGLVAARLKERFKRPAFAIAFTGDVGTGSGRSLAGVDLGAAVRQAVADGLLVKGGGHAMAAGITVAKGRLAEFRAFLEERLGKAVEKARREDGLDIDAAITAQAVRPDLAAMIERAGPYGSGNPEPVLVLPSHTIAYAEPVGTAHLRARLRGGDGKVVDAIAFRANGQPLGQAMIERRGKPMHVAGSLSVDRWQGQERIQFRILDAAVPDGT
ncbi:single-stranded-DNA-specific exonuclease RecJ [Phreatobacter aquaticus]|uniref:Single-stranded-DNA-specific exonuclease RecJ n=1 Tax=Phreatobacter aquaticus TaxID=2570229 RepID=A0A4D7QR08_9HYPH|nr:single-stranded-DNA-specific exonuclease RecJ [Phreatobacter aquaticus]QCK88861.1 single-stranded-DNA-specific exonuclease RecJ [Phreatobacter aquaticus]